MNVDLYSHIIDQHPTWDKHGKFVFLFNYKVAQTSIQRKVLADRCVLHKDGHYNNYKEWKYWTVPHDKMDRIFKFTIVRNPWDRLVSAYSYLITRRRGRRQGYSKWPFEKFVKKVVLSRGLSADLHWAAQYPNAYFEGEQFVDFVGRFENLDSDWKYICRQIGCKQTRLPRKNSSSHAHYSESYTPELKELVAELYADDIELFGYQFEDRHAS